MKKKGLTGMAAALMFSLSVTNMSPLAAVADNTGKWEQSAQTGEWSYRLGQGLVQNGFYARGNGIALMQTARCLPAGIRIRNPKSGTISVQTARW